MENKKEEDEEIVRIELVVPDPVHISGGPFCSFVNLLPISSENPLKKSSVTIDFISLNLYGVAVYDSKLTSTPKFQNTLHFPFLQNERADLQQNQDLSLIFSSDPVVFCTFKEFGPNFEEVTYRYRAVLPPFLPPSFTGNHVSYSYYVYITVQYRNSRSSNVIKTVCKKLEFNLMGSIHDDFPLLDVKYFPILPKSGGIDLANVYKMEEKECIKIIESQLNEKEGNENLYFNFKSSLEETEEDKKKEENNSNSLVSRDLDLIWALWDAFCETGVNERSPYESILESFNYIVEEYSDFNVDMDFHKIQNLREWFGKLFPPELHTDNTENIKEMVKVFLKKLETRMCAYYGKSIEEMKKESTEVKEVKGRSKNEETISFSLHGNKLCTCTIRGFKTVEGVEELEIAVDTWFSIFLDFSEANRSCLKVQVSLIRIEKYKESTKEYTSNVIEESVISLGKSNGSIKSLITNLVVPSFNHSLSKVSYQLEIAFFCFEESVDIFDPVSIKTGLNKIKMVRWTRPVKVLQNECLRSHLDEFQDFDKPGDLKHSKVFSKNKMSSFMFSPKNLPLYKVVKI